MFQWYVYTVSLAMQKWKYLLQFSVTPLTLLNNVKYDSEVNYHFRVLVVAVGLQGLMEILAERYFSFICEFF